MTRDAPDGESAGGERPGGERPGGEAVGEAGVPDGSRGANRAARTALALVVALLVSGAGLVGAVWLLDADRPAGPGAGASPSHDLRPTPPLAVGVGAERDRALTELLDARASALLSRDRAAFLAAVDPDAGVFAADQARVFDRLGAVDLAEWSYDVLGPGPALAEHRRSLLPRDAAVMHVRLTFRLAGTETETDRDQYLTVVPREGRWLLAGDTDAGSHGGGTERDLWDLGPVQVVTGDRSTVLASRDGVTGSELRRLARQTDAAVSAVAAVWPGAWPEHPVVIRPRTQADMATILGRPTLGLGQVAAVTTGLVSDGVSRGDRVVINPEAFGTLGEIGRQVVITHEVTHLATRASTTGNPPIWLTEGFADYVAYRETPVAVGVVAGDLLEEVRAGRGPTRLPVEKDFDTGQGDVATAYEGAWLACRLLAREHGEAGLVEFYLAMADDAGPGWPAESEAALGRSAEQLTRHWRAAVRELARR